MDQPTHGVPVYAVKSIVGGRPRALHRNSATALQGRIRWGRGREQFSLLKVRLRCLRWLVLQVGYLGRTTKPHVDPTQLGDTPAVLSEKTHSELSSPSSPGTLSGDEDSGKGVRSMQLP